MRGLSESEFANAMNESFVSVWVDPTSGFGTYPLESMKMGIPVIGLVPNLVPEWMNEENGIWINNPNMLADVIADVVQNWLEDNLNPLLYTEMEKTISNYTDSTKFNEEVIKTFSDMINTRLENFEDQLSKFITIE
jgi:glycosyltransferase involved in cell wall biosynthesis